MLYLFYLCDSNMRSLLFLLTAIFFGLTTNCFAQDKIIKLNDREITDIKVLDITANTVKFQRTGSMNTKSIYKDNLFGVVYENGTEKVIYLPDPNDDDDYTIDQMRMFLRGSKDARLKYHSFGSTVTGLAFGIAGPFLASVSLGPLIMLPPAVGMLLVSMGSPNMRNQKVDPKYLNNEEYLMGYQHKARKKKVRNAFFSSLAGIAVGLVIMNNVVD